MPTKREREYYRMGFIDGQREGNPPTREKMLSDIETGFGTLKRGGKRRRKLSKWQQFVKKNSKFPRFKYKSGKKKGMINLKALGVAYRKRR